MEPHGSAGSKKKKEGKKEVENEAIDFGGVKTNYKSSSSTGLKARSSSSGMVKHVGSQAELERVLRVEHSRESCAAKLVCLYFTAKWFAPCSY